MDASPSTKSATALHCALCGAGDDGQRGWRIYLAPILRGSYPGHELEVLCPSCAECERGEDER